MNPIIQVTRIERVYGSTQRHYQDSGYDPQKRKGSFFKCLNQEEEEDHVSPSECEQEILSLWEEHAGDCNNLQLFVHSNVYHTMAHDTEFRERIKKRLSDIFLSTSMLYPAITLARLDEGELYIRIAHNGDLTYEKI